MQAIDKMFECDFGIDDSDISKIAQEISIKLRTQRTTFYQQKMKEYKDVSERNSSFWYSLINEDILNKEQK